MYFEFYIAIKVKRLILLCFDFCVVLCFLSFDFVIVVYDVH